MVLSMPSRPASNGTERRGAPASGHRGAADNPAAQKPPQEAPAASPEAGSSVPVGRSTSRSLPPHWPWWLSSGSVERRSAARCGASQQPGPQRSTAARVATTSAVVAASDAEQLPRAARWPSSQKVTRHQKMKVTQGATWLVVLVVVVQMIHSTACLSRRVPAMHLIGWQNTWEQAPGVPATPSPP